MGCCARVWRRWRGKGEQGRKTNVTTTAAAAAAGLRENICNIIISLFVFFYRSGGYYLSSRFAARSLCFTTASRASASECVSYFKANRPPCATRFRPCSSDDEYRGGAVPIMSPPVRRPRTVAGTRRSRRCAVSSSPFTRPLRTGS